MRYSSIEFPEFDIHLGTLKNTDQFLDDDQASEKLGINSTLWSIFGVVWPAGQIMANLMLTQDIANLRILEIGCRIGLSSLVLNHRDADITATDYHPIIAVFSTTFLMSLALVYANYHSLKALPVLESFIAISMCVLAILKLQDLYTFSNSFITYDVIGKRFVKYAYIYPFAEMIAGVGMLSGLLTPLVAMISIFIGLIGCISVVKAVYIEKRDLKCACVGGDSNVPLGFISLTENIMMLGVGIWMLIK